jgi:hypothetical protein
MQCSAVQCSAVQCSTAEWTGMRSPRRWLACAVHSTIQQREKVAILCPNESMAFRSLSAVPLDQHKHIQFSNPTKVTPRSSLQAGLGGTHLSHTLNVYATNWQSTHTPCLPAYYESTGVRVKRVMSSKLSTWCWHCLSQATDNDVCHVSWLCMLSSVGYGPSDSRYC